MKCLTPSCSRLAGSRGLCRKCYQAAWFWIHDGKGTWEDLEKGGHTLPTKRTKPGQGDFTRSIIEGDKRKIKAAPDGVIEAARVRCNEALQEHVDSIPPYREYAADVIPDDQTRAEEHETTSDKDLPPWGQPN